MEVLALTYLSQGKVADAETLFVKVVDIARRVPLEPGTWSVMGDVANIYLGQGKLSQAELLALESLERNRRVFGDDSVSTLWPRDVLGSIYLAQGKLAEAERIRVKALEGYRRFMGGGALLDPGRPEQLGAVVHPARQAA